MATSRIRISKQLETSATAHSLIKTDASNEAAYLAPGTSGQVLTIDGSGIPTWTTSSSTAWTITDGTTSQIVNAGDTVTVNDGNGITATVSATDILTIAAKLSTDANNDLSFGGDGGLYFSANNLITGGSWNDVTNTLELTLEGGGVVSIPIVDLVSAFLADFVVAGDTGSDTINNHETLTVAGALGLKTAVTANTITISVDEVTEHFSALTTGTTLTLANSTTDAAVMVATRNGVVQWSGTPADYSISGTTLTVPVAFGISSGSGSTGETFSIRYRI
jgi:hypothetical protein